MANFWLDFQIAFVALMLVGTLIFLTWVVIALIRDFRLRLRGDYRVGGSLRG
jgi:hypothetical protein